MTSDSMTIADDSVVSFHYKLRDDTGTFNESSEDGSPVVYMHGHNNIVPGLEKELAGKKSGDKLTATVTPEEGYGSATTTPCSACRSSISQRRGQSPSGRWSSSTRARAAARPACSRSATSTSTWT